MILRIKGLIQITIISIAMTVGAQNSVPLHHGIVHAGDEIASHPSDARNDVGEADARSDTAEGAPPNDNVENASNVRDEEAIKIPDVVATANGVDIIRQELENRMLRSRAGNPELFDAMNNEQKKYAINRTLDSIISREIFYQEAVKRGIVVTDKEINMNLEDLKKQFPSEKELEDALAKANMTITAWKEEARKDIMMLKLEARMAEELKISDDEINEYYEKNKKELNKEAVKISHILVGTEEDARDVIKGYEEGKDFGELAKKYSIDATTKDIAGDLGWYVRGELLPDVEEAAFSLASAHVSPPVKSQHGYHVIKLDEKRVASDQTIEDHGDHVRSILQQTKWEHLRSAWLKGLRGTARVWKWSP